MHTISETPRLRALFASLLFLLVTAALLPSGGAGAAEPARTLLAETFTKPGWRAYKVRSDGNWLRVQYDVPKSNKPVQIGGFYYQGADAFLKGFTYTAYNYKDAHYYDINVVPGGRLRDEQQRKVYEAERPMMVGDRLPGTPADPKTYTLLLWWSGDTENGVRLRITGEGGVRLGAVTSGTDAHLLMSQDFDAAANGGANASAPPSADYPNGVGGGVRATAGGSKTFTIDGTLIGEFVMAGSLAVQGNVMTVTPPGGELMDCGITNQCRWWEMGEGKMPPGAYTFTQSGTGAGIGEFHETALAVVDATFPACTGAACFPPEETPTTS